MPRPRPAASPAVLALALAACSGGASPAPPAPCTASGIPGTCVEAAACGGYSTGTSGPCAGALVCCTPAVAAPGCDPAAHPQPNAGLVEAAGTGGCPAGMALVDTFCVDRYEAALVIAGTGDPWSPYWSPGATAVRAVSLAGAVPQGYASGTQAAAACAGAGKRLCTDAEWLRACRGPATTVYPYGNDYQAGACNDTRAANPVVELFGTTDTWIWSFTDHPCLNQLPASLADAGERAACVTAEGLHDLAGNLNEWTSDPAGTMRGGSYVMGALNGAGCSSATTAHGVTYYDFSTGFRCCADP